MKTVNMRQEPFRHEFYAIAMRKSGTNLEVNGQFLQTNLFFNSPYQVISWDILPDWVGWYIIFDREFIAMNPGWQNFIIDYPFFRLDKGLPMDLLPADEKLADELFNRIFDEYHSTNTDKFHFIQNYTQLLLLLTKRYFNRQPAGLHCTEDNRTADILLIARLDTLIERMLATEEADPAVRQPSYYAEQLHVHPNHLNAVVKRITGKTVTAIIQLQVISNARSLLRQTGLSIKEIAFRLHFIEPTHFNSYFKKHTGATPQQYRLEHKI